MVNKKIMKPNLFGNYTEKQVDAYMSGYVRNEVMKMNNPLKYKVGELEAENQKLKTRIWRAKDRASKGMDNKMIVDTLNGKTKRGKKAYSNNLVFSYKSTKVGDVELINVELN